MKYEEKVFETKEDALVWAKKNRDLSVINLHPVGNKWGVMWRREEPEYTFDELYPARPIEL